MSTEQLTGLQLAVKLLAQIGDDDSDRAIAAVHDLAEEHAQRVTLQHDAAADERDALMAERDRLAMQENVLTVERDTLQSMMVRRQEIHSAQDAEWSDEFDTLRTLRSKAEAERDALRARLAEIEAQEPVAWIEHSWSGSGGRQLHFERRPACLRDELVSPVWTALYTRPVPAQAAPDGWRLVPAEITEAMHAAAVKTIVRCSGNTDFPPRVWGAMIAAAPEHKA